MDQALSNIKVLDLTHVQAGPSCAQMLGFLGADVIKVEDTRGGDSTRADLAHREDSDSVYFLIFNNNKRAITLDLKTDKGKEMFVRLAQWADVLVENFSPGMLDRLGPRMGRAAPAQPEAGLCHHQGLRHLRPVCRLQGLRVRRAGRGRRDGDHRLRRQAARDGDSGRRRLGQRTPRRHRHPSRPPQAGAHRRRPDGRGLDAGLRGEPDAHVPDPDAGARHRPQAPGSPGRAGPADGVPMRAGWPQRLRDDPPARGRLGPDAGGDGQAGPDRRPALRRRRGSAC